MSPVEAMDPAPLIERAKVLTPVNRLRLGTVAAPGGVGSERATVTMDDGGTAEAYNAAGVLIQGDRVWVQFFNPQGAVIIDRVPDRWHEVDQPGEPQYAGTWGTWPGESGARGPAKFIKDRAGNVETTGAVSNPGTGLTGSVVFQYSSRYRPGNRRAFAIATAGGTTEVRVDENGDLIFGGTDVQGNNGFNLDGIRFVAEA